MTSLPFAFVSSSADKGAVRVAAAGADSGAALGRLAVTSLPFAFVSSSAADKGAVRVAAAGTDSGAFGRLAATIFPKAFVISSSCGVSAGRVAVAGAASLDFGSLAVMSFPRAFMLPSPGRGVSRIAAATAEPVDDAPNRGSRPRCSSCAAASGARCFTTDEAAVPTEEARTSAPARPSSVLGAATSTVPLRGGSPTKTERDRGSVENAPPRDTVAPSERSPTLSPRV